MGAGWSNAVCLINGPLKQNNFYADKWRVIYLERHVANMICEWRLCPEQSRVRTWGSEWAGSSGELSVPGRSWKRQPWFWTHKWGGNESRWGGSFMSVTHIFASDSVLHQRGFLVPASWSNVEKIGRVTQKNDENCWKAEKILHAYISRALLCMCFYSVLITIAIQTPFSSALRNKAYICHLVVLLFCPWGEKCRWNSILF